MQSRSDRYQTSLPGTGREPIRATLQRRADAALKPASNQKPADIGLFSDTASQTDLVDMANRGRK